MRNIEEIEKEIRELREKNSFLTKEIKNELKERGVRADIYDKCRELKQKRDALSKMSNDLEVVLKTLDQFSQEDLEALLESANELLKD